MICPRCDHQFRPDRSYHYAAAARTLANLPEYLTVERARKRLTLHQVSAQVGLSIPAISRAENGLHTTTTTSLLILRWLAGGS